VVTRHGLGIVEALPFPDAHFDAVLRWTLPAPGFVLVAGHGLVLGVVSSRLALSAAAVLGFASLLFAVHFNMRGWLSYLFP
jgi:hypothetical protein